MAFAALMGVANTPSLFTSSPQHSIMVLNAAAIFTSFSFCSELCSELAVSLEVSLILARVSDFDEESSNESVFNSSRTLSSLTEDDDGERDVEDMAV